MHLCPKQITTCSKLIHALLLCVKAILTSNFWGGGGRGRGGNFSWGWEIPGRPPPLYEILILLCRRDIVKDFSTIPVLTVIYTCMKLKYHIGWCVLLTCDHDGLRVSSQTVLEQPRQHRVSIGDEGLLTVTSVARFFS